MLFNSYEFIFAFFPVVLAVWFWSGRHEWARFGVCWLVLASLFFYGWWNPAYLPLLLGSVVLNYASGAALLKWRRIEILVLGVCANLGVLAHFKYAAFFLENVSGLTGANLFIPQIALPIGISFFTFQQIAWLADVWRGKAGKHDFWSYALFVSFFPQLIAGPIVHHSEIIPQFRKKDVFTPDMLNFAAGFTIFTIGLFKKVVIADNLGRGMVDDAFFMAANGREVEFWTAWQAALAYTFQIYFDFSGYSDMAIGLARFFGIRLPVNFSSPYKARNAIEFWRRWHITLSRFLRDYLYIPLGGNRHGDMRRYMNIMIVMLLGGLWHGAAWTFVVWGGMHGVYLLLSHLWRWRMPLLAARTLTFFAVVLAWVVFRAQNGTGAIVMLQSMNAVPQGLPGPGFLMLAGLLVFVQLAPNTQEWMGNYQPVLEKVKPAGGRIAWRPTRLWAVAVSMLFAVSVFSMYREEVFIYFQF